MVMAVGCHSFEAPVAKIAERTCHNNYLYRRVNPYVRTHIYTDSYTCNNQVANPYTNYTGGREWEGIFLRMKPTESLSQQAATCAHALFLIVHSPRQDDKLYLIRDG